MLDPEEITVIVHSATGLKTKSGGSNQFFVKFGLGDTKYRTSDVEDPKGSPVWNEENVVTVNNQKDEIFLIVREKDQVLGQILVPIFSVNEEKGQMQKLALQTHKKCRKPQGELTYQCFISKYRNKDNPLPERSENKKNIGQFLKSLKLINSGENPVKNNSNGDCHMSDKSDEIEETVTSRDSHTMHESKIHVEKNTDGDSCSTDEPETHVGKYNEGKSLVPAESANPKETAIKTDSKKSNDLNEDTEEITLEELIRRNTLNQKMETEKNKSEDSYTDNTDTLKDTLANENVESYYRKTNNTNSISQESMPKPVPMPRSHRNKTKESVKKDSHGDCANLDETETVKAGHLEKDAKTQDTAEKNKKKRFNLKLFGRKNVSEKTKKAPLKGNNLKSENAEVQTDAAESVVELLDHSSCTSEETDEVSHNNELDSDSSLKSYPMDKEVNEEQVALERQTVKFHEEDKEVQEHKSDIRDTSFESEDACINGTGVATPSNKHSKAEKYMSIENESNRNSENKTRKDAILLDACENNEPVIVGKTGSPVKKKKSFSFKNDSVESNSNENGNVSGRSRSRSLNSLASDKTKKRFSLPFIDKGEKEPKEPEVAKCTPNRGPVDEPTKVCIEGFRLGTGKSDILSLKLAGCECLDTVEFESPEKIYCKTHFQFESRTGNVEIITKSGGHGILENGFTFFDEIDKYRSKQPNSVTDQGGMDRNTSKHDDADLDYMESFAESTNDSTSLVILRPRLKHLPRSASETALSLSYEPDRFSEEQTDSMFRVLQGRRQSASGLKPRRKAPPVPEEPDIFAKIRNRRRASESALLLSSKGRASSSSEASVSIVRRNSDEKLPAKRMAPPPPANARLNVSQARKIRPANVARTEDLKSKSLSPVQENDDAEKEELKEKIQKLEEEKSVLQRDVTRLRKYVDNLVTKVMDRCPMALLKEDNRK